MANRSTSAPQPPDRYHIVNVRLPDPVYDALAHRSRQDDRSMSAVIRTALRCYLDGATG